MTFMDRALKIMLLGVAALLATAASRDVRPASLTNPLRHYHQFRALRPFGPQLQEFVDHLKGEGRASVIAVYFRSLNDGVWIGIDERIRFAPASLMKVPLMMTYLKEAETNPAVLQKPLPVESTGDYHQWIPSTVRLKKGQFYPVSQLLEIMIRDSNNDAMLTLSRYANAKIGIQLYRELGYTDTFLDRGDFLSLKTYVGTFRVLYNATCLNETMSERALQYLVRAGFDQGIVAGVPQGVVVAQKFGEYVAPEEPFRQLHDVGIVYHPDNPYLLGIMTRGDDYDQLAHVIREISAFIYREVDRQYKSQGAQEFPYEFEEED